MPRLYFLEILSNVFLKDLSGSNLANSQQNLFHNLTFLDVSKKYLCFPSTMDLVFIVPSRSMPFLLLAFMDKISQQFNLFLHFDFLLIHLIRNLGL